MPNDLCDSLLVWLRTFDVVKYVTFTSKELTDGLILSSVLNEIAPGWFNLADSLKENINDNWRLKVSNLRKVKNAILDYYQEVLELDLVQFPMPDCNIIGEHADEEHLGRLLQLVLGCAVHCDEKEEHIKKIMGLEEHVQTGVMQCIQELMEYEMPRNMGNMDYEKKLELSNNELENANREGYPHEEYSYYGSYQNNSYGEYEQIDLEKVEEYKQKIHDLEIQIQILQESNDTLHNENERLELKCKTDQNSMNHMMQSQGDDQGNVSQLIEDFHAERYQLELARDDYKIKCETLESEIGELTERCMELQELATASKRLKDEVDELKYRLTNTAKIEMQLESYKKKIEEIPDLRNQIKTLESQIDNYVMEKVSLEDENKRHTLYKNQLEKYKVDIRRLQEELLSETKRADKSSIEAEKYKAKCEATESDNFNLLQERASLKEALENLQYSNNNDSGVSGTNSFVEHSNHSGPMSPHTKEIIARLQKENENLRLQVDEKGITDTDLELLRDELKDSKEYQQKVQEDLRVANQKIARMESDIKIGPGITTTPTQELIALQDALSSEKSRHRETMEMLDKKNNRIKELEPRVKSAAEAINSLKDIIKKKDDEIKTQEEKYKRFLGKAKQVIKAIDPKGSQSPSPDTAALRKQLAEKERALMRMEEEAERLKTAREREERMVLSAWYEMGMHVHKKGLEERLQPQMNSPRSLLSQKRGDMRRSTVSGKSSSTMR